MPSRHRLLSASPASLTISSRCGPTGRRKHSGIGKAGRAYTTIAMPARAPARQSARFQGKRHGASVSSGWRAARAGTERGEPPTAAPFPSRGVPAERSSKSRRAEYRRPAAACQPWKEPKLWTEAEPSSHSGNFVHKGSDLLEIPIVSPDRPFKRTNTPREVPCRRRTCRFGFGKSTCF